MGYGAMLQQSGGQAVDPARVRQRDMGVERCRKGQWAEALPWLASAFEQGIPDGRGWPVAASYLGYCIAINQGRRDEGAKLCRHALRMEVFSSEIWHNLARIHLLQGDRRQAVEAVRRGLSYEPDDIDLGRISGQLGVRRDPPLRFLSRGNAINRLLGRLRSAFGGSNAAERPAAPAAPARPPRAASSKEATRPPRAAGDGTRAARDERVR
jgi:tetratricopeptide (TPR) repeat protein